MGEHKIGTRIHGQPVRPEEIGVIKESESVDKRSQPLEEKRDCKEIELDQPVRPLGIFARSGNEGEEEVSDV